MRLLVIILLIIMITSYSGTSKIWTAQGTVLEGDPTDDESNAQEPTVIRETGAQILTGTVFKMWLKGGWDTPHLNYYESTDGLSWTAYGSNPLLSGAAVEQPFVFKDGSTYYLYTHASLAGAYKRYSSSDGLAWNLDQEDVLTLGAGGTWDDFQFGNLFVWKEDTSDWRMIYEARNDAAGVWKIGYATSSDGLSWSKSGSNPVIDEAGSVGGPFVYKNGTNDYWMWAHRSASGVLPTDLARYKSSDLTTWTRSPANLTLTRATSDEGNTSSVGQISDPHMVEVSGQVYMFFMGNADGSQESGHGHIKLAIARLSFAQIIHTLEGY